MKNLVIMSAISTNANAQKRDVGEWSIIPKVGVNLAKLKGEKIGLVDLDDKFIDFSYKLGFVAEIMKPQVVY